jgi:hypothetical protein
VSEDESSKAYSPPGIGGVRESEFEEAKEI